MPPCLINIDYIGLSIYINDKQWRITLIKTKKPKNQKKNMSLL